MYVVEGVTVGVTVDDRVNVAVTDVVLDRVHVDPNAGDDDGVTDHVGETDGVGTSTPVNTSAAGANCTWLVLPTPSCPFLLSPQHRTPPPAIVSAHVKYPPAVTAATPVSTSSVGVNLLASDPSPSCP